MSADESAVKVKEEAGGKVKKRAADYSACEILLLARAYSSCSEDETKGTNVKGNKFWIDVSQHYDVLKEQHEKFYSHKLRREAMNKVSLRGGNIDDDVKEIGIILPERKPGSLQQKWSKFV